MVLSLPRGNLGVGSWEWGVSIENAMMVLSLKQPFFWYCIRGTPYLSRLSMSVPVEHVCIARLAVWPVMFVIEM